MGLGQGLVKLSPDQTVAEKTNIIFGFTFGCTMYRREVRVLLYFSAIGILPGLFITYTLGTTEQHWPTDVQQRDIEISRSDFTQYCIRIN